MPDKLVKRPKRSIIIGVYNEADLIENSLERLDKWLIKQNWTRDSEVIIVTADSPDKTPDIVTSIVRKYKYMRQIKPGPRVGKGRDIRLGMLNAKGDYIIYMDADLATPLRHLLTMNSRLEAGIDAVVGVRDLSSMHSSWQRKAGSLASNSLIKLILWQNIGDTQCGFKGFRCDVAKKVFQPMTVTGWGFDLEIFALLKLYDYKYEQIVVDGWHDPKAPGSGLVGDSQLGAMIETLSELMTVRMSIWKGKYK